MFVICREKKLCRKRWKRKRKRKRESLSQRQKNQNEKTKENDEPREKRNEKECRESARERERERKYLERMSWERKRKRIMKENVYREPMKMQTWVRETKTRWKDDANEKREERERKKTTVLLLIVPYVYYVHIIWRELLLCYENPLWKPCLLFVLIVTYIEPYLPVITCPSCLSILLLVLTCPYVHILSITYYFVFTLIYCLSSTILVHIKVCIDERHETVQKKCMEMHGVPAGTQKAQKWKDPEQEWNAW